MYKKSIFIKFGVYVRYEWNELPQSIGETDVFKYKCLVKTFVSYLVNKS